MKGPSLAHSENISLFLCVVRRSFFFESSHEGKKRKVKLASGCARRRTTYRTWAKTAQLRVTHSVGPSVVYTRSRPERSLLRSLAVNRLKKRKPDDLQGCFFFFFRVLCSLLLTAGLESLRLAGESRMQSYTRCSFSRLTRMMFARMFSFLTRSLVLFIYGCETRIKKNQNFNFFPLLGNL